MARIVYSALIDNIRGSIGGTTFQKNAYGYTIKKKPNMVRPWTSFQKEMQIYFTQAVRAWKTASDATRNNWDTWAATNPQYSKHNPSATLTGFACFVKWHVYEFLIGGSVDTNPLLTVPAAPAITTKLILSGGILTLNVSCPSGIEDWNLAYFLSRPFGDSQNFIGTKPKYVAYTTDTDGTVNITALYAAKYGSLPALGDRVAVDYVRFMETGGQVNTRIQEIITVTAS